LEYLSLNNTVFENPIKRVLYKHAYQILIKGKSEANKLAEHLPKWERSGALYRANGLIYPPHDVIRQLDYAIQSVQLWINRYNEITVGQENWKEKLQNLIKRFQG